MICFIALLVFAVMGIFSATHRRLAREAFDCVFRKVTLRKCQTGLDTRLKAQITGFFMKISPSAGRFVFKRFEWFSFLFTAIFIWSIAATAIGGFNFYIYGNCNGPNSDGFCLFDPAGKYGGISEAGSEECIPPEVKQRSLSLDKVESQYLLTFNPGKENTLVFIGCYACPYTRDTYPTIRRMIDEYDLTYQFAHFPVKENSVWLSPVVNCLYLSDPEKVMEFNDLVFATDVSQLGEENIIQEILRSVGANPETVLECASSSEMVNWTEAQFQELKDTNIYGTPLVFVNGKAFIGPKPYRVYKREIR